MIIRFKPEQWNRFKAQIMELERICFGGKLEMSEADTKECMCAPGALVYLATFNGVVIGNTYGNILSKIDKAWFENHWNPRNYKHDGPKTVYITSTAVHPDFRGQHIATKLKKAMMKDLRQRGFRYVIGHAHKGPMLTINEKLGAKVIQKFPRWYGSKQTHYLYEIEL
jgi:ribosomal protein S18 acetylase RimI-like enzyme